MTVTEAVLRTIIAHYPIVKNHLIEQAHPGHKLSGLQRFREIRKLAGASFPFDMTTNTYDFSEKPIEFFRGLLLLYQSGCVNKESIATYVDKSCRGDEEKIEGCINYLDVLEAITGYDKDFIKGYLRREK